MAEYEKKVREILKNMAVIWSDMEKVTMRFGLVL